MLIERTESEVLPLAACCELSENSRLGFGSKVNVQEPGLLCVNSQSTLGMHVSLPETRVGSRIQTWNRYAYVGNNPLNAVDPSGLYCAKIEGDTEVGSSSDEPGCGGDSGAIGTWGDGEFGDYSGPLPSGPFSIPWPVFLAGIGDVLSGIGSGGGGGHYPSHSTPYTNPSPSGSGTDNDPYTFHTWVWWPRPGGVYNAQIGPYGPPKPTGWWSYFTTLPGTNYCGPGGRGKPRNGVDELCMEHDACEESSGADFRTNIGMLLRVPLPSRDVAVSNCDQTLCEDLGRIQPQGPGEAAQGLVIGAVFGCIP